MASSKITDKHSDQIQSAMAVALLKLKNAHNLTYRDIGQAIDREKQSVQQYICDTTEMPASCWLKAVAEWPELAARLEYELDDAEKDFLSRQRELNFRTVIERDEAA